MTVYVCVCVCLSYLKFIELFFRFFRQLFYLDIFNFLLAEGQTERDKKMKDKKDKDT